MQTAAQLAKEYILHGGCTKTGSSGTTFARTT